MQVHGLTRPGAPISQSTLEYSNHHVVISTLSEALQKQAQWHGSLDELVQVSSQLLLAKGAWGDRPLRAPTRSLVVDYRTNGLVSPAIGKQYQWLHLTQLVVGCVLVQLGLPRKAAAKRLQSLTSDQIIGLLDSFDEEQSTTPPALTSTSVDDGLAQRLAHEAVHVLAAGLVHHFRQARAGEALEHGVKLSAWLRGALSRFASLYLISGLPVQNDGVHELVSRSRQPLREREWGLPVFDSPTFRFHGIRLLDANTRLPTIECLDLARQITSELDLQEQQAFSQLNSVCDQFASRGNEVYAALREFIVRHPVTSTAEQRRFLEGRNMQLAAPFLASCYEPVQPHHMVGGVLYRCSTCGSPMVASIIDSHIACATRQCKGFDTPTMRVSAVQAPSRESLVAKAHILVYWCAPGQDEISLFDTAVAVPPGLSATLYPARDKCDLALDGDTVGIDVKSHSNPFVLAESLNRGLGGLELFPTKIIAVNDQALSRFPDYINILRREFKVSCRPTTYFAATTRRSARSTGQIL